MSVFISNVEEFARPEKNRSASYRVDRRVKDASSIHYLTSAYRNIVNQKYSEHTLHEIVYSLRNAFMAHATAIVLKERETQDLVIRSHCNLSHNCATKFRRPVGAGAIGRLFHVERLVTAEAVGNADDYADLRLDFDYAVAKAARIELSGQATGYIVAYWRRRPEPELNLEPILDGFAAASALSLLTQEHRELIDRLRVVDQESRLCRVPAFRQRLSEELCRCRRHKFPLSIALVDFRNIKEITNTYGLSTANELFLEAAALIKQQLREPDVACRFGTDEIMMYFPQTDAVGAENILARIQSKIMERRFTTQGIGASLHIGSALWDHVEDADDLIERAQKALYDARLADPLILTS